MEQCMAAMGSGAGAQGWVSLLHTATTARAAFHSLLGRARVAKQVLVSMCSYLSGARLLRVLPIQTCYRQSPVDCFICLLGC